MAQEQKKYTWDDTIAAVGQDFAEGVDHQADETIAYNDVVRYNEVWEYGNLLYWDEEVAKQAGYRGVVVPWSAIKQTFSYKGFWRPGQPTRFPTPDLHVSQQGVSFSPVGKEVPRPQTSVGIFTDMVIEFFEPVCVGDQLSVKGNKLVNVRPRETRIGVGAFMNRENEFYNQHGKLVARANQGGYSYEPKKQGEG